VAQRRGTPPPEARAGGLAGAGASRSAAPAIAGLAFDLDGTVYLGQDLLPEAAGLIAALAAAGVPYLFATNNSSTTGVRYVERLTALGLQATRATVLTSNDVTVRHLHDAGLRRPFLVATREVEEAYRAAGLEPAGPASSGVEPDAVVLTFDTSLTYAKLRRAADLIRAGLPYVATHPDLVCPTPTGPIPDCGAFAALLFEATGRRPRIMGKPERPMADAIRARLGVAADAVAFVGDRLYTDVRMARDHGFVAVLTLTGEARREDLAASDDVPDLVVEDLAALHAHLRGVGTLR
jgi:HAD superfamily hydrolase (TIGR01450 family)